MPEQERFYIEGKDAVFKVWENPDVRGVISQKVGKPSEELRLDQESVREGFGSVVAPITLNAGESVGYVLKVPKVGQDKPIGQAIKSFVESGASTEGLWVASRDDEAIVKIDELQANSMGVYDHKRTGAEEFMFMLLAQLPPGDTYLRRLISGESKVDPEVYFNAGRATRQIHDQEISIPLELSKKWQGKASTQIISGDERYFTISNIIGDADWFTPEQKNSIRRKMGQIGKSQYESGDELVRTHGDNWEGNWWVADENHKVTLFDPAMAYGHRGDDVAFGVGKQVIAFLATGDNEARVATESFYDGYGRDDALQVAKQEMWKGIAYKMIVGAAFDRYERPIQEKLITFADALLQYKIDHPNAVFSNELAADLWTNR